MEVMLRQPIGRPRATWHH